MASFYEDAGSLDPMSAFVTGGEGWTYDQATGQPYQVANVSPQAPYLPPGQPGGNAPPMWGPKAPNTGAPLPPMAQRGIGSDFAASGEVGLGAPPDPAPTPDARMTLPPPRAPQPGPPPVPPAQPRAPVALAPPAPPPPPTMMPPPPTTPAAPEAQRGLLSALGINVSQPTRAALGAGLKSVGEASPGGSGMFLRGLGNSMQGGQAAEAAQAKATQDAKKLNFEQSSGAFRNMMSALQRGDNKEYKDAQIKYLDARSKSVAAGSGATGSRAWQMTDYGKSVMADNALAKERVAIRQNHDKWYADKKPEERKKLYEEDVAKAKVRIYKDFGIDPDKAEKLSTAGKTRDNPFDTKGMTQEQFDATVPPGGFFLNSDGKVYQRKAAAGASAPEGGASTGGDALADEMTGTDERGEDAT